VSLVWEGGDSSKQGRKGERDIKIRRGNLEKEKREWGEGWPLERWSGSERKPVGTKKRETKIEN